MRKAEQNIEAFKTEIRQFVIEMQGLKGSFEAHIAHTDRLLDFLMRRSGSDNAA